MAIKIRLLLMQTLSLCCVLFLFGCSFKQDQKEILFEAETRNIATLLSVSEAEELAKKLTFSEGKQVASNDLSFALKQSLAYGKKKPAGAVALNHPGLTLTYGELVNTLEKALRLLPSWSNNPKILAEEFSWYRIGPDFACTGYYEPTLNASKHFSKKYNYPLYRMPASVKKGVPFYTRHEIDRKGALSGQGLELAWVNSEVDAFFLHVQGSGRLAYDDGHVSHILYAGKNNRSYASLGRKMKEQGLLVADNISMRSIKEKIATLTEKERSDLLDENPSYVFFREASKGPYGGMGYLLTPWVSVAVDRTVLPHGSLGFLRVPLPDTNGQEGDLFDGIIVPQDTGGAIKEHRLDLFCGTGENAEHTAGFLNSKGAVYILGPKK